MNDKKVCFITCVNNQKLYSEALYYINQLEIPEGYEIECISVENAESMAQGYNKVMKASDAKYKVYLHQDTYIINRSLIKDIVDVFVSNDKIGMMGVTGAKVIPVNGVWLEAKEKLGKVYDSNIGQMELSAFNEVSNTYETVQTIDGLIMITQYDILWQEDIFDGWHFYDASQSTEFRKAGYEVVIPRQEKPWIIHDCGVVNISNGYEYYRKVFLEEYSKYVFPLVSILIPTYNQTKFLKEALESAINQTYLNTEIIIGDDSTTNEVEKFVKPYLARYRNITYYKNKRDKMDYGVSNVENLFKKSKGEYISYLLHDDAFHEEKVEKMMEYFINEDNISLITSYRKLINGNSEILEDLSFNKRLFESDKLIKGMEMSKYIVSNTYNPIGELSTAMFKRKDIEGDILEYHGKKIRCNGDIALWLKVLEKGDLIYISDCLNYFRQHNNQNSNNLELNLFGVMDWLNILEVVYQRGALHYDEIQYRKNLASCYNRHFYIVNYLDNIENKELKTEFISRFTNFLQKFLVN